METIIEKHTKPLKKEIAKLEDQVRYYRKRTEYLESKMDANFLPLVSPMEHIALKELYDDSQKIIERYQLYLGVMEGYPQVP